MFAANAELDVGPRRAAAIGGELDEFADALDIEADERIARVDALVDVSRQEARSIVSRHSQGGLGQVVGAE